MRVIYKNEDGVCIVELPNGKYYYGNGETFGGVGVSPNQFLRFNPCLVHAKDGEEVPKPIREWIEKNVEV